MKTKPFVKIAAANQLDLRSLSTDELKKLEKNVQDAYSKKAPKEVLPKQLISLLRKEHLALNKIIPLKIQIEIPVEVCLETFYYDNIEVYPYNINDDIDNIIYKNKIVKDKVKFLEKEAKAFSKKLQKICKQYNLSIKDIILAITK